MVNSDCFVDNGFTDSIFANSKVKNVFSGGGYTPTSKNKNTIIFFDRESSKDEY